MISDEITRNPLCWPPDRLRTPPSARERARFGTQASRSNGTSSWTEKARVTVSQALDRLLPELELLGAREVIVSTNVPTKQDGMPYGNAREPSDPGAAVYFQLNKQPHCLSVDRWDRVADNIAAIAAHVEAMRGQLRWGVTDIARMFAGYRALPAVSAKKPWWEILGTVADAPYLTIEARWRFLIAKHHPDAGGNGNVAAEINAAWDEARAAKGVRT